MDLFRFREKRPLQGVGYCRGLWPWNVAWLGFVSGMNSYANELEDHPNRCLHLLAMLPVQFTVLPPLGVSFSLQIGD